MACVGGMLSSCAVMCDVQCVPHMCMVCVCVWWSEVGWSEALPVPVGHIRSLSRGVVLGSYFSPSSPFPCFVLPHLQALHFVAGCCDRTGPLKFQCSDEQSLERPTSSSLGMGQL